MTWDKVYLNARLGDENGPKINVVRFRTCDDHSPDPNIQISSAIQELLRLHSMSTKLSETKTLVLVRLLIIRLLVGAVMALRVNDHSSGSTDL